MREGTFRVLENILSIPEISYNEKRILFHLLGRKKYSSGQNKSEDFFQHFGGGTISTVFLFEYPPHHLKKNKKRPVGYTT